MASEQTLTLSDETIAPDELLTDAQVSKLKADHGEFTAVKTVKGVAVFRAPKRAEYSRYKTFLFDEKSRSKAPDALVCWCVVHPPRETFESWLETSPGIIDTCFPAVSALAGVETEAQTKKYSPT